MSARPIGLFKTKTPKLNIIEEFAGLTPNRKMVLCDRLFNDGMEAYERTVKTIWPNASSQDVQKLQKFIILLKKTAH